MAGNLTMADARGAARAADVRARDAIAGVLDECLVSAPMIRTIGAKLLTRSLACGVGTGSSVIAGELQMSVGALTMMITRAGGASIAALRREMILVRLAAMFEDRVLPWRTALDVLGAPDIDAPVRIIQRETDLSPGVWRRGITFDRQFARFRNFVIQNAGPWARIPTSRRCPRCHGILPT
jgi:hypothetical protein